MPNRENLALDALIVGCLRIGSDCEETIDLENLPELNAEERAAMDGLGDDFVERLISEANRRRDSEGG
jgi:hypothetical protein